MKRQRGLAVITAMLVVALAASLAAFVAWQQHLWTRQVENLAAQAQGRAVALAALQWARALLAEDARAGGTDHLQEDWAQALAPLPADGGELSGAIRDQQGLFNLNSLVRGGQASEADGAVFRRLLEQLGLPPDLDNAVVDWIDADSEVRYPGGAEDGHYLTRDPPYRAANRPLTTVDGLYRVQGFDRVRVERLRPFVSVLPVPTPVNVNTAPPEVLAALVDGLTLEQAKTLTDARDGRPFRDLDDFRQRLPPAALAFDDSVAAVGSRYFLVAGHARFDRARVGFEALLERGQSVWPTLVWQKNL
ncbi:general secretion pathway protein GspK [Betaproteobacteria bacterium SCN1]|mgnify:FL=1|jgi:general secretion pathway protein K|nr:general secretion pathway protein GspK [Betaproteobacteria bacterium SCN1]MBN8760612.1 type II secretion system minor pseudopilin GspK [Thiobacillus sp.]ODU88057.1 MAG: hypothetical protein ABT21_11715 [Thiobacillus sp. SCN 65-179]OJW36305.1 MAG: hypothetical protein BGO61_01070 [Thiobacillus sp. 65-69]